jgi:hypothetical protein
MLLPLRSLWEKTGPPPPGPFIPHASGVAVIYQLGMAWALDGPGGRIVMPEPHTIGANGETNGLCPR